MTLLIEFQDFITLRRMKDDHDINNDPRLVRRAVNVPNLQVIRPSGIELDHWGESFNEFFEKKEKFYEVADRDIIVLVLHKNLHGSDIQDEEKTYILNFKYGILRSKKYAKIYSKIGEQEFLKRINSEKYKNILEKRTSLSQELEDYHIDSAIYKSIKKAIERLDKWIEIYTEWFIENGVGIPKEAKRISKKQSKKNAASQGSAKKRPAYIYWRASLLFGEHCARKQEKKEGEKLLFRRRICSNVRCLY